MSKLRLFFANPFAATLYDSHNKKATTLYGPSGIGKSSILVKILQEDTNNRFKAVGDDPTVFTTSSNSEILLNHQQQAEYGACEGGIQYITSRSATNKQFTDKYVLSKEKIWVPTKKQLLNNCINLHLNDTKRAIRPMNHKAYLHSDNNFSEDTNSWYTQLLRAKIQIIDIGRKDETLKQTYQKVSEILCQ